MPVGASRVLMPEVTPGVEVNRWRRHGHDRLYVTERGVKIGWIDLQKGTVGDLNGSPEAVIHVAQAYVTAYGIDAPGLPASAATLRERDPQRDMAPAGKAGRSKAGSALRRWQRQRRDADARSRVKQAIDGLAIGKTPETLAIERGIVGERRVAKALRELERDGWRSLHAWTGPGRKADIDHFVVGPGGAFTINAKCHEGKRVWVGDRAVKVGGFTQGKYLPAARDDAHWAALRLGGTLGFRVEVAAMIVFVDVAALTVVGAPDGVDVLELDALADHLRGLPPALAPDAVHQIHATAHQLASADR